MTDFQTPPINVPTPGVRGAPKRLTSLIYHSLANESLKGQYRFHIKFAIFSKVTIGRYMEQLHFFGEVYIIENII